MFYGVKLRISAYQLGSFVSFLPFFLSIYSMLGKIRQRKECFSFENFLQIQQPLLEKVITSQLEIRSKQTVKRTYWGRLFEARLA